MKKLLLISIPLLVAVSNILISFNVFGNSCIQNSGIAFGLDLGYTEIFSFVTVVLLIFFFLKTRSILRYNMLAIAILGAGNLVERVLRGSICDFLNIFGIYVNLTDISITILVTLSLIVLIKEVNADSSPRRSK